jgi:hypothetical protein
MLPMVRSNVLHPSSGWRSKPRVERVRVWEGKSERTNRSKEIGEYLGGGTSVSMYQTVQHHLVEDSNPEIFKITFILHFSLELG